MVRYYLLLLFMSILCADLYAEEAASSEPRSRLYRVIEDSTNLRAIREEIGNWDQSVRGFRSEHNFSLIGGMMNASWDFKRFDNQVNRSYRERGYLTKFQYSYHISIYRSFGYFLGSAFGLWVPKGPEASKRVQSGVMLPGVVGGTVLNMTPGLRLMAGIDYHIERWSRLRDADAEGSEPSVSITARVTDLFAALDVFYRLKWAFRMEYHRRRSDYKPVRGAGGFPVDAVLARDEDWLAAGLTYHLM
jgi:hypothetical protein